MFTEDLDGFFGTGDFAIEARIDGRRLNVIFDRAYLRAFEAVSTTNPIALAKASDDFASVGSTIRIDGTDYTIRDRQPQDDGATVLLQLEKQ